MKKEQNLQYSESQQLNIADVSGCFSSLEYRQLNNNKGKQKAFINGWNAAERGLSAINCPYSPKVKGFLPTCPYYKSWHSGYQSFLNNR